MLNTSVFHEVQSWKKPLHLGRTFLASAYAGALKNVQAIGITGSVGKTLTQNAIASVLSQKFKVAVGEENLDPTFRIPKTILMTKPWYQKLVLEYGVEHPGDMDHYLQIIKPDIAVVTSIAPTHIKYFGSVSGVFDEKSKIVSALPKEGFAVLNVDDPNVSKMANLTHAKVFWYGQKAEDGVKISHFRQDLSGSTFRLHYKGQRATVNWRIIGNHHLVSAYAAATVGLICGLTIKQIAKGLSQTKIPQHRLQVIPKNGITVIDDTYNSSPKAARRSVQTLVDLGKNRFKAAVLGEMKDLGELSAKEHKVLGEKIAKTRINLLITQGPVAKLIATSAKKHGFRGKMYNASSTSQIIKYLKRISNNKQLILVKASRHAHFERIVSGLLGKPTEIHCYHCGELK